MEKNKRGLVVLTVVFSLLFAGIVGAQVCPGEDADTIMKLYSVSNSHVSTYNGHDDYLVGICCSEIFGPESDECQNGDDHIHSCTGENEIIGTYDPDYNSHAQEPYYDPGYPNNICYRDLGCIASYVDCPDGMEVVRLFSETNSHVEKAGGDYPIRICCRDGPFYALPQAYFGNMQKTFISVSYIGNTVLLIYKGQAGRTDVTYTIYERDSGTEIRTISNGYFDYDEDLAAEWVITEEDFDKSGPEDTKVFKFDVEGVPSNDLTVDRDVPGVNNEPPHAVIINPEYTLPADQRRFQTGQVIDFEEESWDKDNPLKIRWEFDDGSTGDCEWPKDECDTSRSFGNSGTKPVNLRVTELNRPLPRTDSDYTEVYIYSAAGTGINLFPIISAPTSGASFELFKPVLFDGSESYVSKCSSVAGCPGMPAGLTCYQVGSLWCFDYPNEEAVPYGIGEDSNQYNLSFKWTFSNGDSVFGDWINDGLHLFEKWFFKAKKYQTNLTLGYQPMSSGSVTWGGLAITEFQIVGTAPVCDQEDLVWRQWMGEDDMQEWNAMVDCYRNNGVPGPICCPVGYECGYNLNPSDPNYMKCYISEEVIDNCEDYTEEEECNSDTFRVAARSVAATGNFPSGICEDGYRDSHPTIPDCERETECICFWRGGSCHPGVKYSPWPLCGGNPNEYDPKENGICVLEKGDSTGDCETDNFLTIEWVRKWMEGEDDIPEDKEACDGRFIRTIPCPAKLAFFTTLSFLTAITIIIFIYVLKHKKR